MTNVVCYPGAQNATHDISLSADGKKYGLHNRAGFMQKVTASLPGQPFNIEQESFTGGRGRLWFSADPTGFFDSHMAWTNVDKMVMPVPAYNFALGLRSNDTYITNSKSFWPLYASGQTGGPTRYDSQAFTASASYNADYLRLYIKRVGSPGTFTMELRATSAGDPTGTLLQTVTKTITDVTDFLTLFLKHDWSGVQALTSATVYHIKVYGASGDNADNHWEIGVDAAPASGYSKTSTDATTWTNSTHKILYRVCIADVKQRLLPFDWDGAKYLVTSRDDGAASQLFISGDRGIATGTQSATTLKDTNKAWTVDIWAGASVWIHDGTGDGQLRTIVSNTADTFTVAAWDVNPVAASSRYIILNTPRWTEITGHGLGKVVNTPIAVQKVCMFPQGQGTKFRRGSVNGSSYTWAADATYYADGFELCTVTKQLRLYTFNAAAATINSAIVVTTGFTTSTALSMGTAVPVGTSDYRITRLYNRGGELSIFKEDGKYTLVDGVPTKDIINTDALPSRNNGLAVWAVDNYLYWSFGGSIERTMGGNTSDVMSMRQSYDGLPAGRIGIPCAGQGLIAQSFVGMDGGDSNISCVLYWNNLGWSEAFRGFESGTRIRNIAFQYAEEQRPRLLIDIGGDLVYQDYAKNPANPQQDTGMVYHHEFALVLGRMEAGNQNIYKMVHALEIASQNLSSSCKIEIDYRLNTDVGTTAEWTRYPFVCTKSPSEQFTPNWGATRVWEIRLRAYSESASTPALLNSYRFTGWKIDPSKYQWSGSFAIGHSLEEDDPNLLEKQLIEWAEKQTKITMRALIPGDDNKIVVLPSAPNIARQSVDGAKWDGVVSLLFREA